MEDLNPHNSNCSTPFVSAPSSPAATSPRYFYSAPSSPLHSLPPTDDESFEFHFSARRSEFEETEIGTMSSADELFLNGQIRPLKHLQKPLDARRRTRSMSPLSTDTTPFDWSVIEGKESGENSGSSSRCSSAGRSSNRWAFLKDFMRSKSDGNKIRMNISISSPIKERERKTASPLRKSGNRRGGVLEMHYTAKRAEAEEMRKKTFLPYRQGLFGCLGFTSRSYGAVNGVARALNPVS